MSERGGERADWSVDFKHLERVERALKSKRLEPDSELTHRVDLLLGRLQAAVASDVFSDQHEMGLAPQYDAIAALICKHWLPQAPDTAVAALLTLSNPSPAPRAASLRGAPSAGSTLTWDEAFEGIRALVMRGARGGAPSSFAALRVWFAAPTASVDSLALLGAVVEAHRHLWSVMDPYPAVQVLVLARTLAKWCRSLHPISEHRWSEQRGFGQRRSGFLRAVLAYGTVLLAGTARRVTGRARPEPRARGDYRGSARTRDHVAPAAEAHLEAMRGTGVERLLDAALAHATVAAALASVGGPSLADKWNWHYWTLFRLSVQANETCLPRGTDAVASIATLGAAQIYGHASLLHIAEFPAVAGREPVRQAIHQVRASLGAMLGIHGDLADLERAVSTALTTGVLPSDRGMAALVRALAERLAPHAAAFARVHRARDEQRHAQRVSHQAGAEISLLDRLNVLSDTEAEARKKNADKVLKRSNRALREDEKRVGDLLTAALAAHPGPNVYYALTGPLAHLEAVRVEMRLRPGGVAYRRPVLVGRDELLASIDRWMGHVAANVGRVVSPGELLQGYAVALLARERATS